MRFLIGSSYFNNGKRNQENVSVRWWRLVQKADPKPTRFVVISEADSTFLWRDPRLEVVRLSGNLGHCGQLLSGEKPYAFSGWSITMLSLALMAYADEADFIYSEQDCLAFGPWVRQMYADLGDGDIVFGRRHDGPPWMPCSQSLFLVRHKAIPEFVAKYLSLGTDADKDNLGEHKFMKLMESWGQDRARMLSFGVDRCRPIPWDDRVFYFQQPTVDELLEVDCRLNPIPNGLTGYSP